MSILRTIAMFVYLFGYMIVHYGVLRRAERALAAGDMDTVEQIIKLLAKNGVASEADLMEAAKTADFNYSFIDNDSEDISRLEGYLFPDTYEFYVNTKKPASALDKLISTFNSKIDDELLEWLEDAWAFAESKR